MSALTEALVAHLDLHPDQVSGDGFRVEFDNTELITVHWDGVAYMTVKEFNELLVASGTVTKVVTE